MHAVLDLPIGIATFVTVVALLAMSVGLAITFVLAVPCVVAMFWFTRAVGHVERHRLAALLDVDLADPVPPYRPGSLWNRFTQRLVSVPRWKEVVYCLVRFPTGLVAGMAVASVWAGALSLTILPATIHLMPDDTARFGLFTVSSGPLVWLVALVGVAGVVFIAPWVTLVVARGDVVFARALLGPSERSRLATEAASAEAGRTAAVDTAEAERRRIERDLHDGAQQRLVALAMDLGVARERLESDPEIGRRLVAKAHDEAKDALAEIRDLVRGIHPVILEDRGLDAALSAVVARCSFPVELRVDLAERPPAAVESAAYYVVSEALVNVERHAAATRAGVTVVRRGDRVVIEVTDDGRGGADPVRGTGLAGLAERAAAMNGTLDLLSPPGGPTTLLVELSCAS